jgi:hypothetical protein
MLPGQPLDLGHTDDRAGYSGMEHARCNRQAGARLGNERRRRRRERTTSMVTEVALAIEISQDRRHTSIVAAGHLDGGQVAINLVEYLTGTNPVPAVLELRQQRTVLAVAVDPMSPAATTIRLLEEAGVAVTQPNLSDLRVAHGLFVDMANTERIRHPSQPLLTTAIRHLEQRRAGGADAPERRGSPVDVSPAVAAELAVWGLLRAPQAVVPAIY